MRGQLSAYPHHLALGNARNVLAATIGLPAGNLDALPGPVRASPTAADNSNIVPA